MNSAVALKHTSFKDSNDQTEFAADVLYGLSQPDKTLPCKWFYDDKGSRLFEQITQTAEYYLTRVETALLLKLAPELHTHIPDLSVIIEPGSGSSNKTRILLQSQPQLRQYIPIDISADFLYASAAMLEKEFPRLQISPLVFDFADDFNTLSQPLNADESEVCMVFFPGSTIGNFNAAEAKLLLRNIREMAGKDGWMLIGVDMTQNPAQLIDAYNDKAGITSQFNKNLLSRINHELGADINLEKFEHRAIFNIEQHRIEMHLVSTEAQTIKIAGKRFSFAANEFIHTENSYKYPRRNFESLVQDAGWQISQVWEDSEESEFGIFLLQSST
jgi:dimethylhistidine N-methyltransferase